MNKKIYLSNLVLFGAASLMLALLPFAVCAEEHSAKKPNIVFFFVDDMGWQDTSEPFWTEKTELNGRYRTPNMEKLADQGIKFTQAYACALCSPSRISLMTGANSARHMVTNWTLKKNESPDRKHNIFQPPEWNVNGLSQKPGVERTYVAITLPELLRKEGYRTIHAGKAHFAADGIPSEDPCELGFDVNIAGHCAGGPGSYYGKHNFSAKWRRGKSIWDVPGLEKYHGRDIYLTEALTIEANEAVRRAVEDKKPFYLYMSHYAVHCPWEADPRFIEKYLKQGLKKRHDAIYASMIEGMDKSLGDIMENIEELGEEDNTIVMFMSDNGCARTLPLNLPLRGYKITPYEGGTRVPMIVKWPGVVKPDTVCSEDYMIIEDVFPTFLEMAGVTGYEKAVGKIDGRSFTPLLKGEKGISKGRAIFWHFPHNYGEPASSSVRKDDWKLIYFHLNGRLELYNLKNDIGEMKDLAKENKEKVTELARTLSDHLKNTGALMPIDKRTGRPFPYPDETIRE